MKTRFFLTALLIPLLFASCGTDIENEPTPGTVNFVSANPAAGSEITPNATIRVSFDSAPTYVRVNVGTVNVNGKVADITGPFPEGALALTVTWDNDTHPLNYFVKAWDCCGHWLYPSGGTVKDGEKDVDPNLDRIEITFFEEVSGNVSLQTEDGEDVGWIGTVEGTKAILELVKGNELKNATTYVIRGEVTDTAGNTQDVSVTFYTA